MKTRWTVWVGVGEWLGEWLGGGELLALPNEQLVLRLKGRKQGVCGVCQRSLAYAWWPHKHARDVKRSTNRQPTFGVAFTMQEIPAKGLVARIVWGLGWFRGCCRTDLVLGGHGW
jgi:hypothetical protein